MFRYNHQTTTINMMPTVHICGDPDDKRVGLMSLHADFMKCSRHLAPSMQTSRG